MPVTPVLVDDFLAPDAGKWLEVGGFTADDADYTQFGFLANGEDFDPAKGLASVATFPRANLVLLWAIQGGLEGGGMRVGYGDAPPGAALEGNFIHLSSGKLRVWSVVGGVNTENIDLTAPIFTLGGDRSGLMWVAMRPEATGATVKFRVGNSGPWTTAPTQPATCSADNLRAVVSVPWTSGRGCYCHRFIAEQSDGDISDVKLDQMIAAAGFLAPAPIPKSPPVNLQTTLQLGRPNTIPVELSVEGVPLINIPPEFVFVRIVKANGTYDSYGSGQFTWTQVGDAVAPGIYALTLPKTATNVLGATRIVVETAVGAAIAFQPFHIRADVHPWDAMLLYQKRADVTGGVTVKDVDGVDLFTTQYDQVDGAPLALNPTGFGGHGGWVQQ